LQETSSTTKTLSESLNVSASAGWGPVSASISASLNSTSSTFQQYVATQTDTRFESREYTAPKTGESLIIRWELYDVVTILNPQFKVLGQVTTVQHPDIVRVYADPLLKRPPTPQLPPESRHAINELVAELRDGWSISTADEPAVL
jgi:hypothetical protein